MNRKLYWGLGIFLILVIGATTYKVISDKKEIAELKKDPVPHQISKQTEQHPIAKNQTTQNTVTKAPAETQNAEKTKNDTTLDEKIGTATEKPNIITSENAKTVRMSPHGFGPYPEIPAGASMAGFDETDDVLQELLGRVLVKVWNDGERHIGGFLDEDTGKVYPYYENTLYVEYETETNENTKETYVTVVGVTCSPAISKSIVNSVLIGEKPTGYTLIDVDASGIDPYKFLDLP